MIKSIDVTEESINILKVVQKICGSDNNWKNNFTFTHFVDIFKGMKTQKVILHGMQNINTIILFLCMIFNINEKKKNTTLTIQAINILIYLAVVYIGIDMM